ncbi:CMSS1 isoform X1 [Brachionus plicatilis]|uniref:CMSS1 isoform X1 n=1 Tax=Brachionus plicatilis TaxID=10195 RepID=A0A3M7SMS3_BRAPC|nr:CMSS1 isoform X1 [Brachionus plicatilis]
MADDLDENFQIEEDFLPSDQIADDLISDEPETFANTETKSIKSKTKKKNITEILKLKQNEFDRPSFANKEFKSMLLKYIKTNLSSVEKMDFNLTRDTDSSDAAINSQLNKMLIKRKPKLTKMASFWEHFNKKFNTKLKIHLKKPSQSKQKHSPFLIILCSSAIRCIEIQRELDSQNKLVKEKKLTWFHAFAKHKKLHEQVEFLTGSKSKQKNIDIVYATPQRLFQLIESDCFDLEKYLKYVVIDYTHRDVKLKRFSAFKTDATVFNVDGLVKERFINGLYDPYLIMQLTSNKMFTKTSFEALEATLKLVNRLESWKTNIQVVMSPMTQRKQVGFHDELLTKTHEAPVSEDMRVCFICRKLGHKAAYCRENRNPSAPTSQPRTITNAVINNVMMNDSIIGKCFVNGNPVRFLFDTGTVKTIIAYRIWRQCKKVDSKLIPNKSTIETCSGGPIEVIGTGKCELQLHNFKGEVEVIVVKKLIYDCLSKKEGKNPVKSHTAGNELPLANGDPEEPAQDEDEKKKVEA